MKQLSEFFWNMDKVQAVNLTIFLVYIIKKTPHANPMEIFKKICLARGIIGKMADKNAGLTVMPDE